MRLRRRLAIAALILGAATPLFAQKQIQLLATISDPSGAEVTALDTKDVKVTENGTDATIVSVQPVQRKPKVQILIDNGIGIPSAGIGDLRRGVRDMLSTLPESLEIGLVTTAPQPRFLERPTTDHAKLLQAIDRLAPDSSPGRFVEALTEAADRIDKDKEQDSAYTLFSIATTSGDTNVRDSDVKKLFQLVGKHHVTVHVVLVNVSTNSSQGGQAQTDVGQQITRGTGGRFETIAVPNRLITLLPEMGKEMAKTLGPGARQFRITVDRQSAGALGQIGLGVAGGKVVSNVMLDQK
jgi:hypothetical protein